MTEQKPDEVSRGERGPMGDSGQSGETGRDGTKGREGPQGAPSNDRGPKGDTGQDGKTGRDGIEGKVGPQGAPSNERGPKGDHGQDGKVGATGLDAPSTRLRLLAIFIFVVVVFLSLAYLVQRNSDKIVENRRNQEIETCLESRMVLEQFDTFVKDLAVVEKRGTIPGSPTYDKGAVPTRLERLAIYKAAEIPLPDCSQSGQ